MQLIILVAVLALCAFSFVGALRPALSRSAIQRSRRLYGKIAKNEEKPAQGTGTNGEPESMTLPYNGMVGYEPNNLFYEPIDVSDPLKDTSELPGEDGSDEKIEAIQARIQARVDVLKKTGQWDAYEGLEYGKDPLASQPLLSTMVMQVKACRPFESVSDLGLTYVLVIIATLVIAGYLVVLRNTLDVGVSWYVDTDFDSDFLTKLLGN
ncbi:hypothetical protein B484DRAFT_449559 [Ochromonadaceae sp. CCMP2298]|nr:hypothetical protein B484DRAFT_449559 [Ochromonadaceae sp. CCMP2298]|mmetsp:Transcript_10858/g.24055  ORF Transcript_10858/g.24055 Transcript_10858/m.24055 type:complete len:209 (+) Transcript_10858:129-755(+)